jgi:predicted protein tyrosine phosphatase
MDWADIVLVMEREHKQWLAKRFRAKKLPRIEVLDIPDEYGLMHPKLVENIRAAADPELEAALGGLEI